MNKPLQDNQTDIADEGPAPALLLEAVGKAFHQGGRKLNVLDGVSMTVRPGEMVALIGPSGSGKTTLLNIAGLLEWPDQGRVTIAGMATAGLGDLRLARLRRRHIGFVFQFHRLLPEFSAYENVLIPQLIAGLRRNEAAERTDQLLEMVGLSPRAGHRPGQLSGGEQQRVAIARAVANAPSLLLADEPTGNLDPETAADVFDHLSMIIRMTGTAALIVTHNHRLASSMDRVLTIRGGQLVET